MEVKFVTFVQRVGTFLVRAAESLELDEDALYSSNVHYHFTYADPNV